MNAPKIWHSIIWAAAGISIVGGILFVLVYNMDRAKSLTGIETRAVEAKLGWQNTDLQVEGGSVLHVKVIGGMWTQFRSDEHYFQGEGIGYICGLALPSDKCVEPLPSAGQGALIGRVSDQIFLIGNDVSVTIDAGGLLYLRMNDGDVGLYDNDGWLSVQIERQDS